MTLPQELRDRIYELIALELPRRRIQTFYAAEVTYPSFKVTTSAIAATCHKINKDYEHVARKVTTALEFTALNMEFNDIITYFDREVDTKFLGMLQLNKATIHVNILIPNVKTLIQTDSAYSLDVKDFYPWALLLISTKLEVEYHSDLETWMYLFDYLREDLRDRCIIRKDTRRIIRENIEEIRRQAGILDNAIWHYHDDFFDELQVVRHRRAGLVYTPRRLRTGHTSTDDERGELRQS